MATTRWDIGSQCFVFIKILGNLNHLHSAYGSKINKSKFHLNQNNNMIYLIFATRVSLNQLWSHVYPFSFVSIIRPRTFHFALLPVINCSQSFDGFLFWKLTSWSLPRWLVWHVIILCSLSEVNFSLNSIFAISYVCSPVFLSSWLFRPIVKNNEFSTAIGNEFTSSF